jgi:VIT1/CCC1 family predicted Fe2+/Mn2+ transporter
MFVECEALANLPQKYFPRNDFCVWFQRERSGNFALPLIIGEIISHSNEMDRYRMLLQAVALARLISALRSDSTEHLFIVAIYLTKDLAAERYIVMKSRSSDEVRFSTYHHISHTIYFS